MSAVVPSIKNKAFLDVPLCDEIVTIETKETTALKLELLFEKEQSCSLVMPGSTIKYTVTITNKSPVEVTDLLFRDTIDAGAEYVAGSFTVNGTPETPTAVGKELNYQIAKIAANGKVVITFAVKVLK